MREKKDVFFTKMEALGLALTFDEVILKTGYAEVMPDDISVESRFSRNIPLKNPLVSAAMDRVTEAPMAIEMAKLGGLGIIHGALAPKEQASHVARVKFYMNGKIEKPITVRVNDVIEQILKRREDKAYPFHSFLVLDDNDRLVGLLTRNDFEICSDMTLTAREVMTTELITGVPGTTLDEAYEMMHRHKKKILPLINSDGRSAGMYVWSDVQRIKTGSSRMNNVDAKGQLRVGAAIGVGDEALERASLLAANGVDVLVIDTAHGDSKPVFETLVRMVKELKATFPSIDVVAGNISEGPSARRLADAGADGIKVGQGPGSICTTRVIAGIGCPQVTAVYNCVKAIEGSGIPTCADGGIQYSGDVTKAIAAGAHSVMIGSKLAGTKESPGTIILWKNRQWKNYRGMGSMSAMLERKEARDRYKQVSSGKTELIAEGIEGLVPYAGEVASVIYQFLGGLRRGMGYVGAASIPELHEKADFYRITKSGLDESHPHDVIITEEAPNYHRSES
ncbi:MAG: IMP dehydrogenase [Patescibacteria group bacterium]